MKNEQRNRMTVCSSEVQQGSNIHSLNTVQISTPIHEPREVFAAALSTIIIKTPNDGIK